VQVVRHNVAKSSTDSSPNSSTSGSPSAPHANPGSADSKPKMNARQRRTERRRREREIKSIIDHMESMQACGNGLEGEDNRLFEFQLSEVKSLMTQVQYQQQDNGEGALIEYHLRKLRSLLNLGEPAPVAGESPGDVSMSSLNDSFDQSEIGPGDSHEAEAAGNSGCKDSTVPESLDSLEAAFEKKVHMELHGDCKVLPSASAQVMVPGDSSPEHPSTPDNLQPSQAQPQMS